MPVDLFAGINEAGVSRVTRSSLPQGGVSFNQPKMSDIENHVNGESVIDEVRFRLCVVHE